MRFTIALTLVVLTTLTFKSNAFGQRPEGGSVEFTVLGGLNLLAYEDYYDYFGGDETETYLTIPSGSSAFPMSSMLRMSVWTKSLLVIDIGFSLFNVSDVGDLTTIHAEVGIGASLGESDAKTFPFASLLLGVLTLSNGGRNTEGSVGFQGGIRHFFRKHAAVRIQVHIVASSGMSSP